MPSFELYTPFIMVIILNPWGPLVMPVLHIVLAQHTLNDNIDNEFDDHKVIRCWLWWRVWWWWLWWWQWRGGDGRSCIVSERTIRWFNVPDLCPKLLDALPYATIRRQRGNDANKILFQNNIICIHLPFIWVTKCSTIALGSVWPKWALWWSQQF